MLLGLAIGALFARAELVAATPARRLWGWGMRGFNNSSALSGAALRAVASRTRFGVARGVPSTARMPIRRFPRFRWVGGARSGYGAAGGLDRRNRNPGATAKPLARRATLGDRRSRGGDHDSPPLASARAGRARQVLRSGA